MGNFSATIVQRLFAATLLGVVLWGCGSGKMTTSEEEVQRTDSIHAAQAVADHWKVEAGFVPSDHDPLPLPATTSDRPIEGSTFPSPVPEGTPLGSADMVQGFRVQILSTGQIDVARAKKAALESLFPGESFYLEYDPPTYKIRAGNFLTRFEADRFARSLGEQGYSEAWTVPARVLVSPAKRLPSAESSEAPPK